MSLVFLFYASMNKFLS